MWTSAFRFSAAVLVTVSSVPPNPDPVCRSQYRPGGGAGQPIADILEHQLSDPCALTALTADQRAEIASG
jgi:hypothetical protein